MGWAYSGLAGAGEPVPELWRRGCSRVGLLWTCVVGVTVALNGDARVMKTDDTILF